VAEGVEDHASLAPLAARRTQQLLAAVARLAALELVVAAQAVDLREGRRLGRGTAELLGRVRARVEHLRDETAWRADLDGLARDVADGLLPPGPPLPRG
jgi:histidine ammonia-lyase